MKSNKQLPKDPDLAGVEKALIRSAKSALTLARQTKTPCYIVKDGQIVDISVRRKSPAVSRVRTTNK